MTKDENNAPESREAFFSRDMIRGVPVVLSSRVLLLVIQFGISVVIVNTLGKQEYGLLSVCQAIAALLVVICGLGLNTALVRFAPELANQRNRAGLIRLILRIALIQGGMVLAAGGVLWLFKPQFDTLYFKFDSHFLLLLVILLVGIRLARMIVEDTFTSLFRMGSVATLSIIQSGGWFLLALVVLAAFPAAFKGMALDAITAATVQSAESLLRALFDLVPFPTAFMGMTVEAIAAATFPVIGVIWLIVYLRGMDWQSPPYGIGKRRVLGLSLAQLLNALALLLLQQYSVVFFLGAFTSVAAAGVFRLGFETPLMAIIFIPLATQKVLAAGFAEAYTRDEQCLGKLIAALYRALILTVIPLACFGVFFVSRGIVLIYGAEMSESGPIASIFCVFHVLSLLWMPLSLAVIAKEKILATVPILGLQVAVNLVLNVVLIRQFGISGGVAAMFLTYALTTPIQLYVIARIVGGIYFPMGFLIRITIPMTVVSALLFPLAPHLNLVGFFALGLAYLAVYPVLIRGLRLIKKDEVIELREMNIGWLNRALDLLVAR